MSVRSDVITGSAPYEYTVARAKDKAIRCRRVLLMIFYTAWCVLWLVGGATVFRLFAPLIALVPISLWVLVFFTWRWTQIEYDYSFFSGELTLCRVLGGRSRFRIAKVALRSVHAVMKPGDEATAVVERFAPERQIRAASSLEAENLWLMLCEDENERKLLLWLELDENALRILRHYNANAQRGRNIQ